MEVLKPELLDPLDTDDFYFLSSSTIFFVILDVIMDQVLECKDILSSICIEGLRTIFFLLIKKKQRTKGRIKVRLLTLYQGAWTFPHRRTQEATGLKPSGQILTLCKVAQRGKLILQKRVSISAHKSLSLLFLFCSPFFLCFVLLSTSFCFFLILSFSVFY